MSECWTGDEDETSTCMLPEGHDGPHDFTPDDEIIFSINPERL